MNAMNLGNAWNWLTLVLADFTFNNLTKNEVCARYNTSNKVKQSHVEFVTEVTR